MQKPPDIDSKPSNVHYDELYKQMYTPFKPTGSIWPLENLFSRDFVVVRKTHNHEDKKIFFNYLFPSVDAAEPPKRPKEPPKRPPPMKYKDLPIYQSPHYEYKEYIEDRKRCPGSNCKILQSFLYPSVQHYRQSVKKSVGGIVNELCLMKNEVCDAFCKRKQKFKDYMRAKENLTLRRGVVTLGAITGLYFGSGTRSTTRKLFGLAVGTLAAGALCFPKETDKEFRNISYKFGKMLLAVYNLSCSRNLKMEERMPCEDEKPPAPVSTNKKNKICEKK